jgi:hypothetical protein
VSVVRLLGGYFAWSREPVHRQLHPRLDEAPSRKYELTSPQVFLGVEVRPRLDGTRIVELALVNEQQEPRANTDTAWLFQPKIIVTAAARPGHAAFRPIDDPLNDTASDSDIGQDDADELGEGR